jgi:hypothetical protein
MAPSTRPHLQCIVEDPATAAQASPALPKPCGIADLVTLLSVASDAGAHSHHSRIYINTPFVNNKDAPTIKIHVGRWRSVGREL